MRLAECESALHLDEVRVAQPGSHRSFAQRPQRDSIDSHNWRDQPVAKMRHVGGAPWEFATRSIVCCESLATPHRDCGGTGDASGIAAMGDNALPRAMPRCSKTLIFNVIRTPFIASRSWIVERPTESALTAAQVATGVGT